MHGDAIMPFIAAREGRLEILKYLRKQEIQWVAVRKPPVNTKPSRRTVRLAWFAFWAN